MKDEFIRPAQVAEILGISYASVYRMTKKGRLPHLMTPANQFVYKLSDILEFQKRYPMYKKEEEPSL